MLNMIRYTILIFILTMIRQLVPVTNFQCQTISVIYKYPVPRLYNVNKTQFSTG